MSYKIALNGFGRIGRQVFKIGLKRGLDIAFINDLTDSKTLANLLKYDSVHGSFQADISSNESGITVNGKFYPVYAIKNPSELPSQNIDAIIEGTGVFCDIDKLNLHLQAGAKKVILTAPAKGDQTEITTIVLGVNDFMLKPESKIISNASCTTNCLTPLAYVLNKEFGIVKGFMNTVHSYTNDQNLLDLPHKDPRRARAAAINIVPSSTGAAKAIGLIIPELDGKLDGLALRVPTPDGSIVDLTAELNTKVTAEEINSAFQKYSKLPEFQGILEYNIDPIVSSDIIGNSNSCIFDSTLTKVISNGNSNSLVKVFGWYDNEWAYSTRIVDLVEKVLKLG